MRQQQYVVAVKRGATPGPVSLLDCLKAESGVEVKSDPSSVRVLIEASDDAIARLRTKIGDWCYIEPMILHRAV